MGHPAHIQKIKDAVAAKERELRELKRAANTLCELEGVSLPYPDAEQESEAALAQIRPDTYYGRPLATAVREILEARKLEGLGAATVNEIYDVLKRGGFQFNAKNDENAKRSLRINLTKNSAFHKVPSGAYGLTSWYPAAKQSKKDAEPTSSAYADEDSQLAIGYEAPGEEESNG